MERIKCFFRSFKTVKSVKDADKMELIFDRNIFGDAINHLNCRSLWKDEYGFTYRCSELNKSIYDLK